MRLQRYKKVESSEFIADSFTTLLTFFIFFCLKNSTLLSPHSLFFIIFAASTQ